VGDAFGGWLTDKLLVKTNNLKFSRRSVAIVAMLGCGTCTLFAALSASPLVALSYLTAAMFFLEMTIGPPRGAVPMDIGGEFSRHRVRDDEHGGDNSSAQLSPTVFGYLVSRGSWVAPLRGVRRLAIYRRSHLGRFWIDPEQSVIDKGEGINGDCCRYPRHACGSWESIS